MPDISELLRKIIQNRRREAPDVSQAQLRVCSASERSRNVISAAELLLGSRSSIGDENAAALESLIDGLRTRLCDLESCSQELANLAARFNRATINIGVSGVARVGKSTTLQAFSGLGEEQIPTGKGLHVTAVRSMIYNSPERSIARVQLRTKEEFIQDFVLPNLGLVNKRLATPLRAVTVEDFSTLPLPQTLGDNVPSHESRALADLREAQSSVAQFSPFLTGQTMEKPLSEVREFVAYPRLEEEEGSPRLYLAVKSVELYCPFPRMGDAPVGLVDLPGLGDINDNADAHLQGLEDNVDQVLVILKPTKEKGYTDESMARNFDRLRTIQPGIKRRGDFILAAINLDEDNIETAKTLQHDFEKVINSSQANDRIELETYSAVNADDVAALFFELLEKLANNLPVMDRETFDYVITERVEKALRETDELVQQMRSLGAGIFRAMPLEAEQLRLAGDSISRHLISSYIKLEERRYAEIGAVSQAHEDLEEHVWAIHDHNTDELNRGLYLGSPNGWKAYAEGRGDYVSFFRQEARRVRARIVESYRGVDAFYELEINALKLEIAEVFLDRTGKLSELIGRGGEGVDWVIRRLSEEVGGLIGDNSISHALDFLINLKFKFAQNVFYNIYESLEELHNPEIDIAIEARGVTSQEKVNLVYRQLETLAHAGNDRITEQITDFQDKFNRYLFTCIAFFNDFLFREDEHRFTREIESMVAGARDVVAPDLKIEINSDVRRGLNALMDAATGLGSGRAGDCEVAPIEIDGDLHELAGGTEGAAAPLSRDILQKKSADRDFSASSQTSLEVRSVPAPLANEKNPMGETNAKTYNQEW